MNMTKEEIIDGLELYTVGRPKKDRVFITVEELQKFIDEIQTLEQEPITISEIPKDYRYDTETKDFFVYRNMYTGDEIHIKRPTPVYRLEQEHYEDCISRQAVIEIAKSSKSNWIDNSVLFKRVNDLPPVTPKPKTGHWIVYTDCEGKTRRCVCDQCGNETGKYTWENPNFCDNCGARMVEIKESEDK